MLPTNEYIETHVKVLNKMDKISTLQRRLDETNDIIQMMDKHRDKENHQPLIEGDGYLEYHGKMVTSNRVRCSPEVVRQAIHHAAEEFQNEIDSLREEVRELMKEY